MFTNIEARKDFERVCNTEFKALLETGFVEVARAHKQNLKRMMLEFSAFDH